MALPYLHLYTEKIRFWGAYLLAQWGVARAVAVDEVEVMKAEARALRDAWSYSVPTEAALTAIAEYSPVAELAAGNGHWTAMLRARGVDALAFDTAMASRRYSHGSAAEAEASEEGAALMGTREAGVVTEGGPELAAQHSDRAMLLVWPDYGGQGSYARDCLAAYTGEVLLLVGEWRGRTFAMCGVSGEAFSEAFQLEVEAKFELVRVERLPSWPGYLDALAVWRRK